MKADFGKVANVVHRYTVRTRTSGICGILTKENAEQAINDIDRIFDNTSSCIEYDPQYGSDVLRVKSKTRSNIFYTCRIDEQ